MSSNPSDSQESKDHSRLSEKYIQRLEATISHADFQMWGKSVIPDKSSDGAEEDWSV